jgi:TolB-like protein/DNA-binding winged helix-turn-helix (wHTH) protein
LLNRSEIQLGTLVFDTVVRDLHDADGGRVELRNKSSEVLARLALQPGKVVSKSEIMDAVWPDVAVSDESLTQCVVDIRRAVGDKDQRILTTHVGKGYSLSVGSSMAGSRVSSLQAMVVVLALAVTGAAGWWFSRLDPAASDTARIAILAFDDLSAGEDRGWLGDGIAEGVTTELASYREFLVIARNSSFSFRDKPVDITEIAAQLDADYIVEGSKQKSGNRLRVTAQLLDGRDGTHIWAHEFDADIGELFDVQSQIARSISAGIGHELAWVPPRAGGREAVSALHYFHKGNEEFQQGTRESYRRAQQFYERSIKSDSDAPFGYAGMATLIWSESSKGWIFGDMPRNDLLKMGVGYAEKAISADPTYYLSHIARGDLYNSAGEHENAILSYQKAVELNPSSSVAMVLAAEPLLYLDRAEEAIATIETAIDVNPIVPDWYRNIQSRSLWWSGRCEEGVATIKKRAQLRPWDYRALIMNLVCLNRIDEARAAGEKILELDPSFTVSEHARRIVGINFPKYEKRWVSSLRAAGLPEG